MSDHISTQNQAGYKEESSLDVVEKIAEHEEWLFSRSDDDKITIQVPGHWCDYSMSFIWNEEVEMMHFTCMFDIRIQAEKLNQIHELLAMFNVEIPLGHFDLWYEESLPMFRHAMLFRGTTGPSYEQVEDVIDTAIMECGRFYQIFQLIIWGGENTKDAIKMVMFDCAGNA